MTAALPTLLSAWRHHVAYGKALGLDEKQIGALEEQYRSYLEKALTEIEQRRALWTTRVKEQLLAIEDRLVEIARKRAKLARYYSAGQRAMGRQVEERRSRGLTTEIPKECRVHHACVMTNGDVWIGEDPTKLFMPVVGTWKEIISAHVSPACEGLWSDFAVDVWVSTSWCSWSHMEEVANSYRT